MSTTRLLLHVVTVATVNALDPIVHTRLVKAHGIMMILAFFIFTATAIMFARYYRRYWLNTKPMGLLIWFHFHRTLNIIAVLLTIAAFVCIFTAFSWQWQGPPQFTQSNYWGAVHSMVGLLAVILVWVQPIGALFRCNPGERYRPIFNWLHRFTGLSAWVLAATAITIAVVHFKGLWSNANAAYGVVIAYLVCLGVVLILQELITIMEMNNYRSSSRVNVLEMHVNGKTHETTVTTSPVVAITVEENRTTKLARLLLLAFFVVICWGLAIALIVMIAVMY